MGLFSGNSGDNTNWMGQKPRQPQGLPQNQQQPVPANTQGQNDPNKPNNTGTNTDILDDIWGEVKKPANAQNDPPANQNPAQQQQPANPQDQVKSYLDSVGLGDFTLSDAEKEQLKGGEGFDEVVNKINQRIQQGHLKAMQNVNTLVEKQVAAAVDKAFEKSKGFYNNMQMRDALQDAFPAIAKDPKFGPVAETVMQQLIAKGANMTQAIEGTKKFFEQAASKMGSGNTNPNTRQNFRGVPSDDQSDDGNQDWLATLRGH